MIRQTITLAALYAIASTTASAREGYICERTRLATDGFSNAKVAGSWYPKEIGFEIDGEQVTASTYGTGVVAPEGSRRILSMDLTDVQSNMAGATMKVRLFQDGRASVWLSPADGYKTTSPSRYACLTAR